MFTHPKGAHLTERTKPLGAWLEQRIEDGTWPYSRSLETSPATNARLKSSDGTIVEGVSFGSQDYLGLASHDSIHAAAIRALSDYGPHSAASAILQGNSVVSPTRYSPASITLAELRERDERAVERRRDLPVEVAF